MDLLLQRGSDAIEAEDYPPAVEHLSALVELPPDFAEGWNARATAFYLMDEYSLSMADVEHVLVLEPRHFGALSGLGFMFEAMDEPTRRSRPSGGACAQPQPAEHQRGDHAARADHRRSRALSAAGEG